MVASTSGGESERSADTDIRLRQPTPGLRMAWDPRLPAESQAFEFQLQGVAGSDVVAWRVDGGAAVDRPGGRYLWPLERGLHRVSATVHRNGDLLARIAPVEFLVK